MNHRDQIDPVKDVEIYRVALERIGKERDAADAKDNAEIIHYVPKLEKCLENGDIKPMEYKVVEGTSVESVLKGIDEFNTRKSTWKKFVVRVAEG